MITAALLNAPIEGSIFGSNTKLLDWSRTTHHHHRTSYNVLVIPGFHIAPRQPEDIERLKPTEDASADRASSSPNQNLEDAPAAPSAAPPLEAPPFTIKTTLSFDDPAISKYDIVDLGGFPVFVLTDCRAELALPPQPPIQLTRTGNLCDLAEDAPWQRIGRKRAYRIPQAYPNDQLMAINRMRLRSQLWFGRSRTASLYQIPTDTRFTIAGQNAIFSSNTFSGLFCVIVRKHEPKAVYVRRIALICLPHQRQSEC